MKFYVPFQYGATWDGRGGKQIRARLCILMYTSYFNRLHAHVYNTTSQNPWMVIPSHPLTYKINLHQEAKRQ